MKIIKFKKEAKRELKKGVDVVGNAIKISIGPRGRNVVVDSGFSGPKVTNDGGDISRAIILKDPIQNIGGNLIKEVAQKTNDTAGDGRKTTVVLYQNIVEQGMKKIFKKRINATGVRSGIEKASGIAIKYLESITKQINNNEEIKQIATISSKSEEIGTVIADTMEKLGKESIISVEEANTVGISTNVTVGMQFDRGYISPYMRTDMERNKAELKDVLVFITDIKLSVVSDFLPLLEKVMEAGKRELVIIAEDIVSEALQTMIINKLRGGLTVLGIKNPGFGERKKDYLEDIATVLGAKVFSKDTGLNIEQVGLEDLGFAKKIVSDKDKTTIVGGKGTKEEIDARINNIKNELEKLDSKHDILKVKERLARLSGGVAVISVGAATETETNYLKLKTEDAVNAVQASIESGILPGGGTALVRASKAVLKAKKEGLYTSDELIGFDVLAKAMEAPLKCIAMNCGLGDGSSVLKKVKKQNINGGFDALNNVYVDDMIKSGIIDPMKVEKMSILNAASGAGMLITTEVAIAEETKPTQPGV